MSAAYGIIWLMSRKHLQLRQPAPNESRQEIYPFNRVHTDQRDGHSRDGYRPVFLAAAQGNHRAGRGGDSSGQHQISHRRFAELVDWPILVLFMGLFVVTGAFQSTGCGDQAVQWLAQGGFNLNAPGNLTLTTAAISNLISNSATVMLLLNVADLAQPVTAYVLALANSFGGNLIVIGSVASIIVVQQARAMGIKISFWDFARLGIPVTVAAVAGLLGWVVLVH